MLHGKNLEEWTLVAELCDNIGIAVDNKSACIICYNIRETATLVSKSDKRQLVLLTYA